MEKKIITCDFCGLEIKSIKYFQREEMHYCNLECMARNCLEYELVKNGE